MDIIITNDKVYIYPNSFCTISGYITDNPTKYIINIIDIVLKNFSDDLKIFLISSLFFWAIGLYSEDFTTGPIPDSNRAIYDKNCVIDDIKPFTFEPKDLIINLGTTKPDIKTTICNNNEDAILYIAFLLLILITSFKLN